MTTVWLIRHGQSTSNAGDRTADPAMIPLSPTGRRQAALLPDGFDEPPAVIVTSPFLRARQTARPTADRFPLVRLEEWPIQEFTYLGSLHTRPMTGAQRQPHVDAYWDAADPSYRDDDGSESFMEVQARAGRFLTRLSGQRPGPVAAFTHGLFMRVVLWLLDHHPAPAFRCHAPPRRRNRAPATRAAHRRVTVGHYERSGFRRYTREKSPIGRRSYSA